MDYKLHSIYIALVDASESTVIRFCIKDNVDPIPSNDYVSSVVGHNICASLGSLILWFTGSCFQSSTVA